MTLLIPMFGLFSHPYFTLTQSKSFCGLISELKPLLYVRCRKSAALVLAYSQLKLGLQVTILLLHHLFLLIDPLF